jgi:mono/diheme cytochrome c family protein
MRVHVLLLTAFALCLAACSKQEPAEPGPSATERAAVVEEVAAARPEFDQAFIDHMHAHAEQLDELMFALADGDLEGAMTPAFWLSRHDAVQGIPEEWQQFVTGMREAAAEVEAADDLETARAAAERISNHCQACHSVAGISDFNGG